VGRRAARAATFHLARSGCGVLTDCARHACAVHRPFETGGVTAEWHHGFMSEPVEPEQDPDGDFVEPFEHTADGVDEASDEASPGYETLGVVHGLAGWSEMTKKSKSITDAFLALYPTSGFSDLKAPQLPTSVYAVLAGSPSRRNALVGNIEMPAAVNARPYEGLAVPFMDPMMHITAGTNELLADLVAHGEAAALEAARAKRTESWRFWVTLFFVVVGSAAAVWGVLR